MSRYARAYNRVQHKLAEWRKAATVATAVIDGNRVVVSLHQGFIEANKGLCAVLDTYFEKNPAATGHEFTLVGLRYVVPVGQRLPPDVEVL